MKNIICHISFLMLFFSVLGQEEAGTIGDLPKLVVPIGHTGTVESASFSPDNKKAGTFSGSVVKIWDVRSGRLLVNLNHTGSVLNFEFSSDGSRILTSDSDSSVYLWNAQTGSLLFRLNHRDDYIWLTKFSPDARRIISSEDSIVKIWDAFTGKALLSLKQSKSVFKSASFSADGKKMAVVNDTILYIWDIDRGMIEKTIVDSLKNSRANFSPNNESIVLSSTNSSIDSMISIASLKNKTNFLQFVGIGFEDRGAVFSPDGKVIYGRKWEKNRNSSVLMIWDANSGKVKEEIEHVGPVQDIEFNFDGKKFLTYTYCQVKLWDSSTTKLMRTWELCDPNKISDINVSSAEFSSDGTKVIIGLWKGGARIYDVETGNLLVVLVGKTATYSSASLQQNLNKFIIRTPVSIECWNLNSGILEKSIENVNGKIYTCSYFSNSEKILVGYETSESYESRTLKLAVWDSLFTSELYVIPHENISYYSISPDSKKILTASYGQIKIWDASTGTLLTNVSLRENVDNEINSAVFSSDGTKLIAFAQNSYSVPLGVWDAHTGEWICDMIGPTWAIQSVHFTPDGKKVIACSHDFVGIWEANSGKLISELKHGSRAFYSEISPDGSFLATDEGFDQSDSYLNVWKVNSGESQLKIKFNPILKYFTPDSKKLVATSGNHNIYIWDVQSGELLNVLTGHNYEISDIQFLKDEDKMISVSQDNTCKLWNLTTGELVYTFFGLHENGSVHSFGQNSSGYYQASPGAAKMLHYVTKDLKIITFEQLDLRYNRPDKVLESLENQDIELINSYRRAYEKRIRKMGMDTTVFNAEYSVPETDIANLLKVKTEYTSQDLKLQIRAKDSIFQLDRINIWVNEVPIYGERGLSLRNLNVNQLDTFITILLSEGENRIETSVTNANAIESFRSPIYVNYTPEKAYTPKTHFIGIGIDHFQEPDHDLSYSVKDVRDLAKAMKAKLGDQLTIDTLFNQNVSISNVQALKKRLLETNINDKVIISYSGHGLLSKEYDYYLSSYTVNFQQPEIGGIPYEVLEDLLDSIPARHKLLLIDACHSGEVDKDDFREMAAVAGAKGIVQPKGGDVENTSASNTIGLQNSFQLMQELFVNVQKGSGATIISAAAGDQFALEGGKLENGFFTYAILQYITNNQSVAINELKRYVYAEVERLSGGLQKPTSRIENLELDWKMW